MIYVFITGIFLFYSLYTLILIISATFYKTPEYSDETSYGKLLLFYPAYKPDKKFIENLRYMKEQVKSLNADLYVLSQDGHKDVNDHFLLLKGIRITTLWNLQQKGFRKLNLVKGKDTLQYCFLILIIPWIGMPYQGYCMEGKITM